MPQHTIFYRFGVALVIGILVGLQREHAFETSHKPDRKTAAGVRTFALMGLAGCTAAFAADLLESAWVYVGIILPLGLLIATGYFVSSWRGEPGMTTEVAAIVVILAGSLCFWDQMALAVAIG
ncbi:MAG: MgtC/SapB family protein, partial [Anaerolineales bacterium]|nr:MgtC/SapB family protein [Anaerolineales bacterium]